MTPTAKAHELDVGGASYREKSKSGTASSTETPQPQPFDHAATKRLLRKLDCHLIPFLAFMYL
jgi:hypothetical protein